MATCEHTCGFCAAEKCFDAADGCSSLRNLCNHPQFSDIMRHQCTKTCGKCENRSGTGGSPLGGGGDTAPIIGHFSGEMPQLPVPSTPSQPFVIASTAKPFVFTPPTPPATTPLPQKEIVVVVRPPTASGNKRCYDKSTSCAQHKKLCNDWVGLECQFKFQYSYSTAIIALHPAVD